MNDFGLPLAVKGEAMDIQVEMINLCWIAGDCEVDRLDDDTLQCCCCLSQTCEHVEAVRAYEDEEKYGVGCRECPECEGKGEIYQEVVSMPPYSTRCEWVPCPACDGERVVSDDLYERYRSATQLEEHDDDYPRCGACVVCNGC